LEKSGATRRSTGRPDDDEDVTHPQVRSDPAFGLVAPDAHRAKEFYEAVLRVPLLSGSRGRVAHR
jgi:hypothetical protein